jgi:hypothetical protein
MKAPDPFAVLKDVKVPLLIAFFGLAGGIIGSFVGPYLTAQHQTAKDITDRRVAVICRPKKPQDSGNRAAFYW